MEKKDDTYRLNTIVYTTLEIVRKICFMLYPIIPESSLRALKIFNINESEIIFSTIKDHNFLKSNESINQIDILFKKLKKMIDSHCHLDHEPLYENIDDVLNRSKNIGLTKLLTICTTIKGFEKIQHLVNLDPIIYGTLVFNFS